jgi:hypothetical protein
MADLIHLPPTIGFAIGLIVLLPLREQFPTFDFRNPLATHHALMVLLIALPIFIPLVGARFNIQYDVRYVLSAMPPFYLLAAHALLGIAQSGIKKTWIVIALIALLPGLHTALTANEKEDYRSAFGFIHAKLAAGECVEITHWDSLVPPPQWRLYNYDDIALPLVNAQHTGTQEQRCTGIWLMEYQRVPSSVRRGAAREAKLRQTRDVLGSQQFFWFKVVHLGPSRTQTSEELAWFIDQDRPIPLAATGELKTPYRERNRS